MSAREGRVLSAAHGCGSPSRRAQREHRSIAKRTRMEKRSDLNASADSPQRELSVEVAMGDLTEQSQTEKHNDFDTRIRRRTRGGARRDLAEQSRWKTQRVDSAM